MRQNAPWLTARCTTRARREVSLDWLRWARANHTYSSRTVPDLRDRPAWSSLSLSLASLAASRCFTFLAGGALAALWLALRVRSRWRVPLAAGGALCRGVYQKLVNPTPETKHPSPRCKYRYIPRGCTCSTVRYICNYCTFLPVWLSSPLRHAAANRNPSKGVAYRVQNIATAP
jgi:hypothetical protein